MRDRAPPDLFARLPGHFRMRDAQEGQALEALLKVFGTELATLEGDLDQLFDNWFVETAESWALPYIAGIVGATPMRDIGTDQAGLTRAYIANVLQYRQAKGTAAVVEQVARDVSGWSVLAVEFFQRLSTSQHVNHVRSFAPVFPDVRNSGDVRYSRDPFSQMAHGAAAGQSNGWSGRYNIPHLGLFVWRQGAAPLWPVTDDAPYTGGAIPMQTADAGLYRFDPLGRRLGLVNRPDPDSSVAARMTRRTVPGQISRAVLHDALNAGRGPDGRTRDEWFEKNPPFKVRLGGVDVTPERLFGCDLSKTESGGYRRPTRPGDVLVDPERGVLSLHPSDVALPLEVGFAQSAGFDVGGGAYDRRGSVANWINEFVIPGEPAPLHIGVSKIASEVTNDPLDGGVVVDTMRAAISLWKAHAEATPNARGIITIMDSATYDQGLQGQHRIILQPGSKLAVVAGGWPAIRQGDGTRLRTAGEITPLYRRPYLTGNITIDGLAAGTEEGGTLILDGLALGGSVALRQNADLYRLSFYNCTIGASDGSLSQAITCVGGNARANITLDRCICAGLNLTGPAGALTIRRSILGEDTTPDGEGDGAFRVRAPRMDADISGSTVLIGGAFRSIAAENSIFLRPIAVQHRQRGCMRYCFTPDTGAWPRRYRCLPTADDAASLQPVFVSMQFADTGFASLAQCTDPRFLSGAEDGMEMGIGHSNRDPARHANLQDAMSEFAPFGLTAGVILMN